MPEMTLIEKIIVWTVPILFAITVHEVAHGWVASRLGDQTARSRGRLTLNPLKHIDPIGTIVLPAVLLYLGGFIFGWAKPVPVNWQNLGHPRRDMALVAVAGPCANLLMMLLWAIFAKILLLAGHSPAGLLEFMLVMCKIGITINIMLMVLNLFPLLPLDGGRILTSMLPKKLAIYYSRLEPIGLLVLVLMLASGVLGKIMVPIMSTLEGVIYHLVR